ncbi:hypothetical protein EMEDMD4_10169 [Sinorhizobium medicae]|uniref:Uncharacterized protein n=1 Tax=Sinorhizobium medicae TaxID=110321 RepID=A0A508WP17_9HYPH|nr:hypothetical protein EMEDMD4_10169 [Sinorhizobium medicae]
MPPRLKRTGRRFHHSRACHGNPVSPSPSVEKDADTALPESCTSKHWEDGNKHQTQRSGPQCSGEFDCHSHNLAVILDETIML